MPLAYADPAALNDVTLATVALLLWLYTVLFAQSYVKLALVKRERQAGFGAFGHLDVRYSDPQVARIKYGVCCHSPLALTSDRTVGNLLEQLLPCLAATWLRALLVPGAAASAGRLMWVYLLSRMLYPLAFYVGHPLLQLATQPGYLIVFGQLLDLAASASTPSPWWSAMRCEQGIYGLIFISCCVFLAQWVLRWDRVPGHQTLTGECTRASSGSESTESTRRRGRVPADASVLSTGPRGSRRRSRSRDAIR